MHLLYNLNLIFLATDQGGNGGGNEGGADDSENTDDKPQNDNNDNSNGNSQDVKTFDESYVKELRRENARRRTENKKLKEQLQSVQKAIGLDDEELDAEELQNQLTTMQQQLKSLKVEKTFEKVASNVGADDDLTQAVLKVSGKLQSLDPNSSTFTKDLESMVKETLKENPGLKTTTPEKTETTQFDTKAVLVLWT